MARKTSKKRQSGPGREWQPEPEDAIRLAALRWFALTIERLAIQVYATDKSKFSELEDVLKQTVKEIGSVMKDEGDEEDRECPIGYELCRDGICAPMCDANLFDS